MDIELHRQAVERRSSGVQRLDADSLGMLAYLADMRPLRMTLLERGLARRGVRKGDVVMVTKIDRPARSITDLAVIVKEIESKGAALRAVDQPIDTGSPAGRAFLQMLGVFSEFETAIRRERQLDGIAKAKAEGVYAGRKPSIDRTELKRLQAEGVGVTAIANRLGVARASVYRILKAA